MANLKKRKLKKSLWRRRKELAKVALDNAWRRIWVKNGVLSEVDTE